MSNSLQVNLSDNVENILSQVAALLDMSDAFSEIHPFIQQFLYLLPSNFLSILKFEFQERKSTHVATGDKVVVEDKRTNPHILLLDALVSILPRLEREVEFASREETEFDWLQSLDVVEARDENVKVNAKSIDFLNKDSSYLSHCLDLLKFITGYLAFTTCSYNLFNQLLDINVSQLSPEKLESVMDFNTSLSYHPYLVKSIILTHRHDLSLAITENVLSVMLPLSARNEDQLKVALKKLKDSPSYKVQLEQLRRISLVTLNYLVLHESLVNKALSLAYTRQSSDLEDLVQRTFFDLETLLDLVNNGEQVINSLGENFVITLLLKLWFMLLKEEIYHAIFSLNVAYIGLKQFYMGSPEVFFKKEDDLEQHLPFVKDPWLLGFYFNIKASFYMKMQDIQQALSLYLQSKEQYEVTGDTRGLSAVSSNISHCYYYLGRIDKAINNLEKSVKTFLALNDVFQATGNLLLLSKYYLDTNQRSKSEHYLMEANKLAKQLPFKDPIILSLFIYIHGNLDQIEEAREHFKEFESLKKVMSKRSKHGDILALQWAKFAEGMLYLYMMNLNDAMTSLKSSLELADKYKNFQLSVDAVTFLIEAYFKAFLVSRKREYIREAYQLLERIQLLMSTHFEQQSPYSMLITLLEPLTLAALGFTKRGMRRLHQQIEYMQQHENLMELLSLSDLGSVLNQITETTQQQTSSLLEEQQQIIYVDLAIRVLKQVQLRITALGMPTQKEEDLFQLIIIFNQAGLSTFKYINPTYREKYQQDPQLISGFLTAIRSFSNELFGEGLISKIEFDGKSISESAKGERFLIIQQKITDALTCVVITNSDSYELRVGLEQLSTELREKRPDLCLTLEGSFFDDDQEVTLHDELRNIVESVFSIESPE